MSVKLIEKGRLLLSQPFMMDENFQQSAIVLCEHNSKGSLGFILNKISELYLSDIISDIKQNEFLVYIGGPVQQDTLHFLHTKGELIDDSLEIIDGVFWGGDFEQVKKYINSGLIESKDIKFFIGYSGWTKDQLAFELHEKSWVLYDTTYEYIFNTPASMLWKEALNDMGNQYCVIADVDAKTSLN